MYHSILFVRFYLPHSNGYTTVAESTHAVDVPPWASKCMKFHKK